MGTETESLRTSSSARKRKAGSSSINTPVAAAPTYEYDVDLPSATPTKKPKTQQPKEVVEKRLKRFRSKPTQRFQDIYQRATTQRFYVLSRVRGGTDENPHESVELTGSTGNIYTVVVGRWPSCTCPMGKKGDQCKHIIYVLARVLRAKYEYLYQAALLGSELHDIFNSAPPLEPGLDDDDDGGGEGVARQKQGDKRRKPVEGDCPICFEEMEDGKDGGGRGGKAEAIVWCRAACGQNIHKQCFETWAATKRQQASRGAANAQVTCPYCRSVWEGDEDMVTKIKRTGSVNEEGYVNVAAQLGISPGRDTSTYSRWWSGHPQSYRRGYSYR